MVALKSSVWWPGGRLRMTSRICGSKPMSSIRSASSSTTYCTRFSALLPCCRWSMKRPGVATTISTPLRRSPRWSPMLEPPTTMQVRTARELERLKARTSLSICCASSRVGASTRPMGPSPRRSLGACRQSWIMGMANAAVLPEPVSAQPRMSRPDSATGIAWHWMGVGRSYSWLRMSAWMSRCRFMSWKDSTGAPLRPVEPVPSSPFSTVTFSRVRISAIWSSVMSITRWLGRHELAAAPPCLVSRAGGLPSAAAATSAAAASPAAATSDRSAPMAATSPAIFSS
mmetsp:Transcript_14132/g.35666  ORF Transcript_14132/g.35666 Transcript_14132/m.35666 type:complete len:286 (+) Transcript_14132:911-1768(+)